MPKRKLARDSDGNHDSEGPKKRVPPTKSSNDENDTIFIRNLSFDTEEETLKDFVESSFGKTVYCLVCRDKETDESKGTAFAKFQDPQDAAKCLQEFKDKSLQTKFHLEGRNLIVLPAISREKLNEAKNKKDSKKDKRNLNLAREGYINPNSQEAEDLSKSDLEKRRVLDTRKKDLLKNLHNFVSDTRLCVHNLPASVDDQRLRRIFADCVKTEHPNAKIVECRVMRNKKGGGKLADSKGFGFVAFSKHEHALFALRNLNNKPNVFTKDKRPIVEFSIENLVALNKKKTRLVNSQRKNQAIRDQANKKADKVGRPNSYKDSSKKMKRKPTVTVKSIESVKAGNKVTKKSNKAKKSYPKKSKPQK